MKRNFNERNVEMEKKPTNIAQKATLIRNFDLAHRNKSREKWMMLKVP